jgi:hypothetical protein
LVFLENDNYKLYCDHSLLTDTTVRLNRPDITLIAKASKECAFTDIPIPLTHSLQAIVTEKPSKYQEMAFDIRQRWQVNKIIVIPLRLPAMGVNPNTLNLSLTNLWVPPRLPSQVQKMVVLNIRSVVRKFLSDEVRLFDEEGDNI